MNIRANEKINIDTYTSDGKTLLKRYILSVKKQGSIKLLQQGD